MKTEFENAALILVDIQNDFCPGGALAVSGGDQIVSVVNRLIPRFRFVASTQDWHPSNHVSFKELGGVWPTHCVQGTPGAELHPALDQTRIDAYFRKAASPEKDAYSEFEGADDEGRALDEVLKSHRIKRLFVAGLATDYCVKATVLDGLRYGYEVWVITDAIRAVDVSPGDGARALQEMANGGACFITSDQILKSGELSSTAAR